MVPSGLSSTLLTSYLLVFLSSFILLPNLPLFVFLVFTVFLYFSLESTFTLLIALSDLSVPLDSLLSHNSSLYKIIIRNARCFECSYIIFIIHWEKEQQWQYRLSDNIRKMPFFSFFLVRPIVNVNGNP